MMPSGGRWVYHNHIVCNTKAKVITNIILSTSEVSEIVAMLGIWDHDVANC